jgi:acyl-CoA synthetase (AMP-forming)/AMP-acid ligase II
MLSHANLLANILRRPWGHWIRWATNSDDVFVSWLPLYHDMGLIGAWLGSLYYALPLAVMSPLKLSWPGPQRWLWAIHRSSRHAVGGAQFRLRIVRAQSFRITKSPGWT